MKLHYLFPALLLAGCASSHPTAVDVGPGPLPQKHDVSDPASIRTPEQVKAYPVGRYEDLVKDHPERAVRSFMLGKMFKHEAELRQTARQAPQAKEWLEQQEPSLKQRIMERLEKINPFYREKALVREIAREKTRIDFTQKPSLGQGMSV